MQMTKEGLALIRDFEGFVGTAYRCPAGILTIGFGHTSSAGAPAVLPGMKMTRDEAERVLAADVSRFAEGVARAMRRELSPMQFSAIVSFAYNVGLGALCRSSVLKAVNSGHFDAVPAKLLLWVKAGGRVLPGLVRRRRAEGELFMSKEIA